MTSMQRFAAARAVPVTLPEIDQFMRRAFRATKPRADKTSWGEVVYYLTPDLEDPTNVIRVQTSVYYGQMARGEGEDSIRVVLMNTKTNRPIAGKEQRVHRVENWRDNLRKRIEDAIEKFDDMKEDRERVNRQVALREEQERLKQERLKQEQERGEPTPRPSVKESVVTWTKLKDGSWGLRATEALDEGSSVQVAKKDGSTTRVTVGKLMWKGNGVFLYTVG